MKNEGYWVNVTTGAWFEVDDHGAFLQRETCARRAGLTLEAARRIGAMPYRQMDGADRHAILYAGFAEKLVRVRFHGGAMTIETTQDLQDVLPALAPFMKTHLGPVGLVKAHCLPVGPFLAVTWQDLEAALERGDLAALLPREEPLDLSDLPTITLP